MSAGFRFLCVGVIAGDDDDTDYFRVSMPFPLLLLLFTVDIFTMHDVVS